MLVGNFSKGAKSWRKRASVNEFGISGIGGIALVTKSAAAKDLWRCRESKVVQCLHGEGLVDEGTSGRFAGS